MSNCFCLGPQDGQPMCPCKMRQLGEIMEVVKNSKKPFVLGPIYETIKFKLDEKQDL